MASRSLSRSSIGVAVFLSAASAAQEQSPQPGPTPVVTPTPTPSPSPVEPPAALSTPILTPRPGIDDVPTPVFVPNPRPTPVKTPAATRPTLATPPAAVPSTRPTPTPVPSISIARPPIETVILPQRQATPPWPWLLGAAALLVVVLGWFGLRRRRDDREDEAYEQERPSVPVAEPVPVVAGDRSRLAVSLRPTRAGLNLISATAECEVTVANVGDVLAEDVRARVLLTSAREGQEAELMAFYAETVGRSATPAFALAPGEEHWFRIVTALPHDAIHAIDAGGRPMFVPLVALSVRYRDGEDPHRVGQAFMLGVDQGGSAKLAPFWLDGPARAYDRVVARPHGAPIDD